MILDMNKMDRIRTDDLKLPPEVFSMRLERRRNCASWLIKA